MPKAAIDKLEELFGDPEQFSPENMESLVHETLRFFNSLEDKLKSIDEQERDEALLQANYLKTKLAERSNALCHSVGMNEQELQDYISNPAHFSAEEWQAVEKAKFDLAAYNQEIDRTNGNPSKPAKTWFFN